MKIHLLSDLHLESHPHVPDSEACSNADVIVLAGDIGIGIMGANWALDNLPADKPVIYIPGNHEFYRGEWFNRHYDLKRITKGSNVRVLNNEEVSIDGIRFLGSILWTDFSLYKSHHRKDVRMSRKQAMLAASRGINDFSIISKLKGHEELGVVPQAFTVEDALSENKKSQKWLAKKLAEPHDGKTVVVTHFAPSDIGNNPIYDGHPLTPYFCNNLAEEKFFNGKAVAWLHGHIHTSIDHYRNDGTRVTANPKGNFQKEGIENACFDNKKIIEI